LAPHRADGKPHPASHVYSKSHVIVP